MGLPILNRLLVLEAPVRVADGAGGYTEAWEPLGEIWAELSAGTGRETAGEMVTLSTVGYRIVVRGAPIGDPARPPVLPADPDPQPGLIVDPLVWRVLDRRLRWITVDVEGERWSYPLKPKAGKTMWENAPDSDYQSLDAIAPNLIRMTGDWREAIAERPEGL